MVCKLLNQSVIPPEKMKNACLNLLLECHVHRVCRQAQRETTMEVSGIPVTAPVIYSFSLWESMIRSQAANHTTRTGDRAVILRAFPALYV